MAEPPRDLDTRIADTRHRLEHDVDAWVATAGPDGPWMVPLTHVWIDDQLWFATDRAGRTVRNIESDATVRVALGPTRDVVVIDGEATAHPLESSAGDEVADRVMEAYEQRHGSDPREWADALIVVVPRRIQAWREENELQGRTIMRDGSWLP